MQGLVDKKGLQVRMAHVSTHIRQHRRFITTIQFMHMSYSYPCSFNNTNSIRPGTYMTPTKYHSHNMHLCSWPCLHVIVFAGHYYRVGVSLVVSASQLYVQYSFPVWVLCVAYLRPPYALILSVEQMTSSETEGDVGGDTPRGTVVSCKDT